MDKLQELKKELEALNKHYENIQKSTQEMSQKLSGLTRANTELGKLRQENGELRQDNGELKRKLASWQASSIEFYHLMERTLSLSDLNEEYRKATEKFLSNFERYLCPHYGLARIAPLPGEPFQDELHQAVGDEPISSVTREFVSRCTGWGFKVANWEDPRVPETIKPAQVVITALPVSTSRVAPTSVVETATQPLNVVQSDSETKPEDKQSTAETSQAETDSKIYERDSSIDLLPSSQESETAEADRDPLQDKVNPTKGSTALKDENPQEDLTDTEKPPLAEETPVSTNSNFG